MKVIAAILAAIAISYASYWQGHLAGKKSCPEFAKVQDTHNRELEAFFAEQFSEPTGRELACDQMLDTARDVLNAESVWD